MSLDKHDVVPVDTHVWAIARQYMPITGKTLTPKIYAEIGDFFRELHGPYAGWAHSVCVLCPSTPNLPLSLLPSAVCVCRLREGLPSSKHT